MTDWPATGVHFALTRGDLVILDVRRDAYACLARAADHMTPERDQGWAISDPDVRTALMDGGMLSSTPPQDRRRVATPVSDELPDGILSLTAASVLAALGAGLATPRFRAATFAEIVDEARRTRLESRDVDPLRLASAVRVFRSGRPWVPFAGLCLQRAYLLRRHLLRRGIGVDWVFGVRTWPFVAHCWLQADGLVIAEGLDHVRTYDPILVV